MARALLQRAPGRELELLDACRDAFSAVQQALAGRGFDEVVVSVRPTRGARLARRDLLRRLGALDVPVTAVAPDARPPVDQTVIKVRW